ncbi:MAG: sigma-54-dependent Fis family transcriptional regulator [Proteobacteria bacterium]|nr:sigma-54-dependent Fis family transcriptional regulator [Pseudomonadota bacterium]MCP4921938.1 sigma-54-dependent Fis family transcriptional regulator [Pseudomonadota bacterium]
MRKRILIVDDEPSIRKVVSAHLAREGYDVVAAQDGGEAIEALSEQLFHAVVTDLQMPGIGGLELLAWCRENQPGLPVVIITAYGTVGSAVEAIKLGAHDYVTKPFDRDELKGILQKAVQSEAADARRLDGRYGEIIGAVGSMQRIFGLIDKVAASPTTVLITGESGTGKELIARALHERSNRSDQPFITVNCGAIPEQLFESELFGHEKGAFTGAVARKPGRFELADGGTLFLDEVGELPPDLQVKLLRVLQERSFERVGGVEPLHVDVRLVAATNRDLASDAHTGSFRQDLYYRLNVIPIALPPLRDRTEDIPLLVEHFLARFNVRLGREVRGLTPGAMHVLANWTWPGNIRELENLMERSVLLCEGDEIQAEDLPGLGAPGDTLDAGELEAMPLRDYVRAHTAKLERARIIQALDSEDGNVTRAARLLGISRKSLQTKMKDYRLRER